MDVLQEYKELYEKHVANKAKLIIVKYNSVNGKYEYKPYSHTVSPDAIDELSQLIIDNMVFYAFSEDEIVDQNRQFRLLHNLAAAARYAYEQRLPKRKNPDTDGTPGEVLLDILIQVFEPNTQKLIARAKYKQQDDNNEIKGYDALYFVKNNEDISLWLGQVKTGAYSYCKNSIVEDLNKKYVLDYFCKSVFYIADKACKSTDLSKILTEINKICFDSAQNKWDDEKKKSELIELLKKRQVKLKIPCLLAYTEDIYTDDKELEQNVNICVEKMMNIFDRNDFNIIRELEYELIFCVFPLSDTKRLRQKIVNFKISGG